METRYAISSDGSRIAYDISGTGNAVVLLHGGGGNRADWHEHGYVSRLAKSHTVVCIDIRGNGDSDKPIEASAYRIDSICDDICAVADANQIQDFVLWGFSYGGNIGRFLAVKSARVKKLVVMGIPFGQAAKDGFRRNIETYRDFWMPILEAQRAGTFDQQSLAEEDQIELQEVDVPVRVAWLSAMLTWGGVEPEELKCPTLWLIGSKNDVALKDASQRLHKLKGSQVQLKEIEGLDHTGEFKAVETVFPILLTFTDQ